MSSKRNSDSQPLGKAIRELLNSYRLESKFDEVNIIASWERLVGKPVARQTKKVFIKNKVLFAEFHSPSMKHDFSLHKETVLALFKKEFGPGIINEIVLL